MRFLGIDYGSKKTGIALSDETETIAIPHSVVQNKDLDSAVGALIEQVGIKGVILGMSLNYKGEENPIMKEIHQFKERLEERYKLPIHLEPEMLTSYEARRNTQEDRVDAAAAALILQSYLDKIKNQT